VRLDVTRPDEIAAAVLACPDLTLLINNAGIATTGSFLADGSIAAAHAMLETNFFGPLRVSQAFAPTLAANGGGAILNVLSVASWVSSPLLAVYAASKSAAWSLTNGLRHELRDQNTQVLGLHAGFIDTDLVRDLDVAKSSPESIVRAAFDGLSVGASEVLADEISRQVHHGLAADPPVYLQPPNRG
jgi:short-subunit dehydrogenase